jgi:lipopolysaccharide biosynthesis regulator YciM
MNSPVTTPVHQCIYTSYPGDSLTPEVLNQLLEHSRLNNAQNGITGILLHTDDQIMQVVEGPKAAVEALMERIKKDPRHDDVSIIMSHTVAQRDFGEWEMALRTMPKDAMAPNSALSQFFKPDFDIQSLHHGSPASFLLRAFRELNGSPVTDH